MITGLTLGASITNDSSAAERTMPYNTKLTKVGAERDKTPKSAPWFSLDKDDTDDDYEDNLPVPGTAARALDDQFEIVYNNRQLMVVDTNLEETMP
jgi:hypothetical protein